MTKNNFALWIVLIVAVIHGVPSIAGAFLLDEMTVQFRFSSFVAGLLLLAGSWLLFRYRYSSVFVFSASAFIYVLAVLIPAFLKHGASALSFLMGAFYFSVLFRVSLVVAAHFIVKRRNG
jgi:hypothetical protein